VSENEAFYKCERKIVDLGNIKPDKRVKRTLCVNKNLNELDIKVIGKVIA
jgi:hypothetical protein